MVEDRIVPPAAGHITDTYGTRLTPGRAKGQMPRE